MANNILQKSPDGQLYLPELNPTAMLQQAESPYILPAGYTMDPQGPQYTPEGGVGSLGLGIANKEPYIYENTGWEGRDFSNLSAETMYRQAFSPYNYPPGYHMDPMGPQYTPTGGIGSEGLGIYNKEPYTYQSTGWEQNPTAAAGAGGAGVGTGYIDIMGQLNKYNAEVPFSRNKFTQMMMDMMTATQQKYNQAGRTLYETKQRAENRGTDAADQVFQGDLYNPLNAVGMATSAEAAYQPSILSADKQLAALADVYGTQQDIYSSALEEDYRNRSLSETIRSNKVSEAIQAAIAQNELILNKAQLAADIEYKKKTGTYDPNNPWDYTDTQLGRLRLAGIDPTDTEKADLYLYGYSTTDMTKLRLAGIDPLNKEAADKFLKEDKGLTEKEEVTINDKGYKSIAIDAVKDFSNLFKGYPADYPIEKAINQVMTDPEYKITSEDGSKTYKLTTAQRTKIAEKIVEVYPRGRTFLLRLLPGGR